MKKLIDDLINATEDAAICSFLYAGKGDERAADQAAVTSMRNSLNSIDFDGTVVVGEGERDKAPMLFVGESVGTGNGPKVDIALDPLEGTTICANYGPGSMVVLAVAPSGALLHTPDLYMEKIAVKLSEPIVSLKNSVTENLTNLAKVKNCKPSDLTIAILKRERHGSIIAEIRALGAHIKLIGDGDISAIASIMLNNDTDMYIGIGGAPEGVLAASILKSMGGYMEGKLIFKTAEDRTRSQNMGITNFDKIYSVDEIVMDNAIFVATGVTDGEMLKGVKMKNGRAHLNSIVIQNSSMRNISSIKKYYS